MGQLIVDWQSSIGRLQLAIANCQCGNALALIMAEGVMKNRSDNERSQDREDAIRRSLDEQDGNNETFNPRSGEDPGLLELTEDPRERRLKRNTM
jgi:hypothetical protein